MNDACGIVYAKQNLINFINIPKWYPDIPAYSISHNTLLIFDERTGLILD